MSQIPEIEIEDYKPKSNLRIIAWVIILVSFVVMFYAIKTQHGRIAGGVGYEVGYSMHYFPVFLGIAIVLIIIGWGKRKGTTLLMLSVLLMIIFGSRSYSLLIKKPLEQEIHALPFNPVQVEKELIDTFKSILLMEKDFLAYGEIRSEQLLHKTYGIYQPLVDIFEDGFRRTIQSTRKFKTVMKNHFQKNIKGVLLVSNYKTEKTSAEILSRLEKIKNILIVSNEQLITEFKNIGYDVSTKVSALDISDNFKGQTVHKFLNGFDVKIKAYKEYRRLHVLYVDSLIEIVTFLKNKFHSYSIKDGIFIFTHESDLQIFNDSIKNIGKAENDVLELYGKDKIFQKELIQKIDALRARKFNH